MILNTCLTYIQKLTFNLSIKKKALIGYILIIIIPFSILSYYSYTLIISTIRQDYSKNMTQVVDFIDNMISEKAREFEFTSDAIANNIPLRKVLENYTVGNTFYELEMLTNLAAFFDGIQNLNNNIYKVNVFYENNELYNFHMVFYNINLIETNPIYKETNKRGFNEVLWEPQHDYVDYMDLVYLNKSIKSTKEKVFSLYRKIMSLDYKGQIGVLNLDIKSSTLLKGLHEIEMKDRDSMLIILDSNGSTVYGYDKSPTLYEYLHQIVKSKPEKNSVFKLTDSGNSFLAIYSKIEGVGLDIFYILPARSLSQVILQRLISFLLPLGLTLFSVIFFIYFMSALIFKRLVNLSNKMKNVQTGDFDIQIQVDSMDEIGQLKQVFNTMVNRINHLFNTVYKLQFAEKDAALSFLQAQMNPHFLYNILETIRMIAEYEHNKRISNIVILLSKLLKYNIKINTPVSIKDELDIIHCYVSIQNIRFNNKITLNTVVEESLQDHPIKKLLIQPLVENSISYGFYDMLEGCIINITIRRTDENITIVVEDNGQGFTPARLKEVNELLDGNRDESLVSISGNGIGLFNINTRLKLHYGESSRIFIESTPWKKTSVIVKIKYSTF